MKYLAILALLLLVGCGAEIPTEPNPEIVGGWGEAEKTGPKYSFGGGPDSRVVEVPQIIKVNGRWVWPVMDGEGRLYYRNEKGDIVEVHTGPKLKTGGGGPEGRVTDDGAEEVHQPGGNE